MIKARNQSFCRDNIIFSRSITVRDNALFLHNNHFCLIWKSENVSFKLLKK